MTKAISRNKKGSVELLVKCDTCGGVQWVYDYGSEASAGYPYGWQFMYCTDEDCDGYMTVVHEDD